MRRLSLALAAVLVVAACQSVSTSATPTREVAAATRVPALFPTTWRFKPGAAATFSSHAMVVSNDSIASRVGRDILERGGNAVDAAVATGFALAVTYPFAGNIGGGGFMIIRMADGRTAALDYREIAPLAATRNMYLDANGKLTRKSIIGHLAVGVPGAVAGMAEALAHYGTMSLADVDRAGDSTRRAMASSSTRASCAASTAIKRSIEQFEGKRLFFPNGQVDSRRHAPRAAGARADAEAIAARGVDGFYKGRSPIRSSREMQRGGGIITLKDLAHYQPEWRTPVKSEYRGYTILSMPPSSSGGITMTEALNILETTTRPRRSAARSGRTASPKRITARSSIETTSSATRRS